MGKEVLLDSTLEEEKWGDGEILVSFMSSRNEITQLTITGEWPSTRATDVCRLHLSLSPTLFVFCQSSFLSLSKYC